MQQLEKEIKQWADGKWPDRTVAGRIRKLGEEVGELAEALIDREATGGHDIMTLQAVQEAADCAIILSDLCSMLGYSLSAQMRSKFAEVRARPAAMQQVPYPSCPVCQGIIVLGMCECRSTVLGPATVHGR